MGLSAHVCLIGHGIDLDPGEVTRVAAALSKQVERDFGPLWNTRATVSALTRLDDLPGDAWPILITSRVADAAGYHEDEQGQPYALVEYGDDWSLTASHECLEMLADPFGRRLRAGNLPEQAIQLGLPPGRVRYLLEVCDPSEGGAFAYQVNGVLVSDFYTPHYFDPRRSAGVRYSFTGAIEAPRTVLAGGYLSWHDPVTNHWMQLRNFEDETSTQLPHVVDLDATARFRALLAGRSPRAAVDRVTRPPRPRDGLSGPRLVNAQNQHAASTRSHAARAALLRREVATMLSSATGSGGRL